MVTDLILATVALTMAAAFIALLVRRLFDHAEAWDRTTFDDVYSHPDSRGPGQLTEEDR